MTNRLIGLVGLALLVAALGLLAGDGARADDKKQPDDPGVWLYDVRVVRVDPATPEISEKPSTLEASGGTTVTLGWAEMLAALKKRGKTTLLMDQRMTACDGVKGVAASERQVPLIAINFKDDNNTQLRSATMKTGCKFEATSKESCTLAYLLEVKWSSAPYGDATAPVQLTTSWNGTHPLLRGKTLVLSYREQVAQGEGKPARAVEIYGLVTGRYLPPRIH